ncbi:MAG: hypothetical protein M3011_02515 [Actinomycetota bacterium]|nr:hypothetical protein [Actinomycetota bacterium]
MTATIHHLTSPRRGQHRYPDHVDLRVVIRQGEHMKKRVAYAADAWNLDGAPDVSGRASPLLHFDRIPAPWRDLVKDYVLLLGDPALARAWAPGAAADNHAARRRAHWGTARTAGKRTGRLLRLMDELGMSSLDAGDWRVLADEARNRPIVNPSSKETVTMSAETLARSAQVLREIHDLAALHGHKMPFGSRPWGTREINDAVGFRPPLFGERRNAVRPHGHVFAMAGACMNLLARCGDDLIARADWWTRHPDTPWSPDSPDPYLLSRVGESVPSWCPPGDHLLPDATGEAGLWWWCNRLVYASYYVVAAVTALRGAELNALSPDCISSTEGRHTMRGLKIKGQSVTSPPEATWAVNDAVASAVDMVNRLRAARRLPQAAHPTLTSRPLLFSANLLADALDRNRGTLLSRPLEPSVQRCWLVSAIERLHAAGVGESVEGLTLCSHTRIRNTSMDVHVDRPLGDLAAAAVGKWSTTSVALGYIGHRPQVTTPAWSDEVAERNVDRALGPLVAETALHHPDLLTGAGAPRLVGRVAADPALANGPVTMKVLRTSIRRSHASVSVGVLSACLTPSGGLCGGQSEANHRLCQLGCPNMVLTPYHRARLELMRRSMDRHLGPDSHLAAKIDCHDELLSTEGAMTDDELIDILTAEWDPRFRDLVHDLLGDRQP